MIDVRNLIKSLKKSKINFYAGVPDSVLKNFTNCLDVEKKFEHLILPNEGSAVSVGIGYYLSKKKIPAVYMQNSGLGNSLNPIISIAHKKVYQIPLLLIIGWRGAPKIKDEAQHIAQGKITRQILKLCGIKYCILNDNKDLKKLTDLISLSKKNKQPVACLIKNNILKSNDLKIKKYTKLNKVDLTRAIFIKNLLNFIDGDHKIISSTGYLSRELHYQIVRSKLKINPFYMVGGMGHSSSVSLGYSLKTKKKVLCLDGDGSFLMHLGSVVPISKYCKNLKYILLNNNAHESVGGQTTNIEQIKLNLFSKAVGYKNYFCLSRKKDTNKILKKFFNSRGLSFLEVKIKINNSENNLPRPKDLLKIKKYFLKK
jgi:phosphonopyruvate decarboxylase